MRLMKSNCGMNGMSWSRYHRLKAGQIQYVANCKQTERRTASRGNHQARKTHNKRNTFCDSISCFKPSNKRNKKQTPTANRFCRTWRRRLIDDPHASWDLPRDHRQAQVLCRHQRDQPPRPSEGHGDQFITAIVRRSASGV